MSKKSYFDSNRQYSNWSQSLDTYYGQLYQQYGNTPYWNELMANPYLNMVYEPKMPNNDYWSQWQIDNYPQALDYVAKILQRINKTDYDSAIQSVNRERMAGINADIAGNVGAGESAPVEAPSMQQQPSMMDYAVQRTAIADTIINEGYNAIQSIIGVVSSAASINGQNINNAIGSAEAINAQNELFYQNLIDATPIPEFKSEMTDEERMSAYKNALQLGFQRMSWNGISKKDRKYFTQGFENWMKGQGDNFGLDRRLMKTYKEYLEDKEGVVKSVGSPIYRDNIDDMIGTFMDEIGNLSLEVQKAELRFRESVAELERTKNEIDTKAYQGASNDPNYIPNITENILGSPSVVQQGQKADIAEAGARVAEAGAREVEAGARISTAETETIQQEIKREQKKAVVVVGKAFDKAIDRVDKSKRFRTFKPHIIGSLKIMKASTMSLIERWVDPRNPGIVENVGGSALKTAQQAALMGM